MKITRYLTLAELEFTYTKEEEDVRKFFVNAEHVRNKNTLVSKQITCSSFFSSLKDYFKIQNLRYRIE